MEEDLNDGDGFDPMRMEEAREVAHSHLPLEVLEDGQYQRLRETVENPQNVPGSNRKPWGVVKSAKVAEGELISYVIFTPTGGLASKKVQTERSQQLKNLLARNGDSWWEIDVDPGKDTVRERLVKRVPCPTW